MGIPNVKQKLTITGGGAPSISVIQDALGTLRQLGAPAEGGKLTLQQNVNGWAIFIEWTPEPKPEIKVEVHADPRVMDVHEAARAIQRGVQGNPQA